MKYLNNRDNFLKFRKINEAGKDLGPFSNDLGWNDSLLGRFINHSIRSGRVLKKTRDIKKLKERLSETFDYIINKSIIYDNLEENEIKVLKLKGSLNALRKSIRDGEDIVDIKYYVSKVEEMLKDCEHIKEYSLFKEELEDFKYGLNYIEGDKSDEQPSEEKTKEEGFSKKELIIENLTALYKIVENLKVETKKEPKKKFDRSSIEIGNYYLRRNKKGNISLLKVVDINDDNQVKGLFYEPKYKRWRNTMVVDSDNIFKEVENKNGQLDPSALKLVTKDKIYIGKNFESKLNESDKYVEDVKKATEMLLKNKKGFSVDKDTIGSLLSSYKENKETKGNKIEDIINRLYTEIYSYIRGKKRKSISHPYFIVESFTRLVNDIESTSVMGELIARLYLSINQVSDDELSEMYLGSEIVKFKVTMNKILDSGKVKDLNEGIKTYHMFLEDNENEDNGNIESKFDEGTTSDKIIDLYNRTMLNFKKYVIKKSESDKIKNNIDKLSKDSKEYKIYGLDSVVELVKLFNKAYKLYTFSYISKKTEGAGESTAAKYTDFSGDGKGPFRNNKIFDIWEDEVLDILKNPKYQSLFTNDTKIYLPIKPNPRYDKIEDWKTLENGGENLRKFILDMLDGDNLYRVSNKDGKQSKFLDKYFGDTKHISKDLVDASNNNDELVKYSKIETKKYKFVEKDKIDITKKGFIFILKGKTSVDDENKNITRYSMFIGNSGNYNYFILSKKFGKIIEIFNKMDGKKELSTKSDLLKIDKDNFELRFTRTKENISDILDKEKSISIKSINKNKKSVSNNIEIDNLYLLVDESGKPFSVSDDLKISDYININPASFIDSAENSDSITIKKL
jgi:hypothetical protein